MGQTSFTTDALIDFPEKVDDRVAALLVAGTAITLVYNDAAGTITINGQPGVTDHGALSGLGDDDHPQYHTDARGDARYLQLSNANETIDDRVASLLVAGTNVSLSYNDAANTLTVNCTGVTDHGALTGLGDDDHPQYAKKAGDTFSGAIQVPNIHRGAAAANLQLGALSDLGGWGGVEVWQKRNKANRMGRLQC